MPEENCLALLKQLHDMLERGANNSLRPYNLTMSQMEVLIILDQSPLHSMPLKELERRLHVAQSTAAGLVARLEKKGFVESYTSADDHRVKMVQVTDTGAECLRTSEAHRTSHETQLLAGFSPEEREQFRALLARAAKNLQ